MNPSHLHNQPLPRSWLFCPFALLALPFFSIMVPLFPLSFFFRRAITQECGRKRSMREAAQCIFFVCLLLLFFTRLFCLSVIVLYSATEKWNPCTVLIPPTLFFPLFSFPLFVISCRPSRTFFSFLFRQAVMSTFLCKDVNSTACLDNPIHWNVDLTSSLTLIPTWSITVQR